MKKIVLFALILTILGCDSPVAPKTKQDDPAVVTQKDPVVTPVYVPPVISGAKEVNVLRPASGTLVASYRGAIALADPLYGACNEPGTVYFFFDDNALVQYVPQDGTYTQFSLACKGDVEAHNAQEPDKPWDVVTVSAPGLVHDFSHDPAPAHLTIRFLTNAGTLALHPSGNGQTYEVTAADAAGYALWVNADGSPKNLIKGDFSGWGAEDGHTVIHMQLGGDGVSIPAYNYHN